MDSSNLDSLQNKYYLIWSTNMVSIEWVLNSFLRRVSAPLPDFCTHSSEFYHFQLVSYVRLSEYQVLTASFLYWVINTKPKKGRDKLCVEIAGLCHDLGKKKYRQNLNLLKI